MASIAQFQKVSSIHPRMSVFDLSYSKLFNCDAGQLIPVMHDECVPGDVWDISNEIVVRMLPLVAPVLHEINVYVHYFFVPYRLLWSSWEDFVTGGEDGADASTLPVITITTANSAKYKLWDYFGFPLSVNNSSGAIKPCAFPFYAYGLIWNDWYRDISTQSEVTITSNMDILYRNWEKDYFTSALPYQQRGTTPAIPLSGSGSTEWPTAQFVSAVPGSAVTLENDKAGTGASYEKMTIQDGSGRTNMENMFNDYNTFDFADATTFDVADLRLAFQIQKWMERNARAGARYTEYLKAHFGVSPRDERVDRPEYIGGCKQSIIVSEVLQTSETNTTEQGTMCGHGLSASGNRITRYRVKEHGMIMGLLSIMPRAQYSQGINRQWLKETKYDFYSPEFANLSEQAVWDAELYFGADSTDKDVFGYQGRWDEMRTKQDLYCADMRDTFDHWHCGRIFASEPSLNTTFLKCDPDTRIFAVETEPGFIVHFGNAIRTARPLPIASNPGLIDHT